MILKVNGDEWDVWFDASPLWNSGYTDEVLNNLKGDLQALKDSFDFSEDEEKECCREDRQISKNYIVVSEDLMIIGYFVMNKETNETIKKVMLSAEQIASTYEAEQIASTYEDEVTAFQKRKQLVNSLVDKFSR